MTREIQGALDLSRALVVVCSQTASTAPWVNEEISYFRDRYAERPVLVLLVDGDPRSSFPASLASPGAVPDVLAADVRSGGDGKRGALLKLNSAILLVNYDQLRRRERTQRLVRIAQAAVAGLALLAVIGVVVRNEERKAETARHVAMSRKLAAGAENALAASPARALLLSSDALKEAFTPEAAAVAHKALAASNPSTDLAAESPFLSFGLHGDTITSVHQDGSVWRWNLVGRSATPVRKGDGGSYDQATVAADSRSIALFAEKGQSKTITLVEPVVQVDLEKAPGDAVVTATFSKNYLFGTIRGGGIRVWARSSGRIVTSLAASKAALDLAVSKDEQLVLIEDIEYALHAFRFNGSTFVETPVAGQGEPRSLGGRAFALSSNGRALVTYRRGSSEGHDGGASEGPELTLHEVPSLRVLKRITADQGSVFESDAKSEEVLVGAGSTLVAYSLKDLAVNWRTELPFEPTLARYSSGGILVTGPERRAAVLSASGGKLIRTARLPSDWWRFQTSPDSEWAFEESPMTRRWIHSVADIGARDGRCFGPHAYIAAKARFANSGAVVTGDGDGLVIVWDEKTGSLRSVLGKHTSVVTDLVVAADGHTVAATGEKGTLGLWRLPSDKPKVFGELGRAPAHVAFAPDGRQFVAGSFHRVGVFDSVTGSTIRTMDVPAVIGGFEIDGESKRALVLMPAWEEAQILDIASGQKVAALKSDGILAARFLANHEGLVSIGSNNLAKSWEDEGELRCVYSNHSDRVESLEVIRGGEVAVTAGKDGSVRAWSTSDCKEVWAWEGHVAITHVRQAPDGSRIAVADVKGVIQVLDVDTGEGLASIERGGGQIFDLQFSADGRSVLSAGQDRWVRSHLVRNEDLLAEVRRALPSRIIAFSSHLQEADLEWRGSYELDRDVVAAELIEKEIKRDPANGDLQVRRQLKSWADEKAKDLSMALHLRGDGWFVMKMRIAHHVQHMEGTWRGQKTGVRLRILRDKVAGNARVMDETMEAASRGDRLVFAMGEEPEFRLRRRSVTDSRETEDFDESAAGGAEPDKEAKSLPERVP